MSLSDLVFAGGVDRFAEAASTQEDRPAKEAKTTKAPEKKVIQGIVHIRTQQRNGRKCLTLISGLATDLDLEKIVRVMRKVFSTNGTIIKDEEHGEVIQLQGDRRADARDFLTKYNIVADKEVIKMHGF